MSYKVLNISNDARKFHIHKTYEGFYIRPGEELIVPYPLIVSRPDIFIVTDLDKIDDNTNRSEEKIETNDELVPKKKKIKSIKEE